VVLGRNENNIRYFGQLVSGTRRRPCHRMVSVGAQEDGRAIAQAGDTDWGNGMSREATSRAVRGLEDPSESKEPGFMTCVSYASSKEDGPDRGPHDHTGSAVGGKSADPRSIKHFSNLIHRDRVNTGA
jgi:hypothetical protein